MSLKSLPLIFLNMGGEMCYILDQRLQAQNIKKDKATRVLNDIVATMFNVKFMDELFKPQAQYSKKSTRALFDKLAHASIMKLNATSMDKLYDLMTMAVKYQLQTCVCPRDILVVTMNHMDGIRKLVQGSANVQSQVDHAFKLLSETYFRMNQVELQMVRHTVLNFYQESRVKVSVLLREKQQKDDGRFVIPVKAKVSFGSDPPGTIRYFANGKGSKTLQFNPGGTYNEMPFEGVLEKTCKQGERGTELGMNMYKNQAVETQGGYGSSYGSSSSSHKDPLVKEELQLLSHLLKPSASGETEKTNFALSLFEDDEDEENFVAAAKKGAKEGAAGGGQTIKIDASKRDKKSSVDKMMSEMNVKDNGKPKKSKGQDMLDLMDS